MVISIFSNPFPDSHLSLGPVQQGPQNLKCLHQFHLREVALSLTANPVKFFRLEHQPPVLPTVQSFQRDVSISPLLPAAHTGLVHMFHWAVLAKVSSASFLPKPKVTPLSSSSTVSQQQDSWSLLPPWNAFFLVSVKPPLLAFVLGSVLVLTPHL